MRSFGWMGLIGEIKEDSQGIIEKLLKAFEKSNMSIEESQILAWRDSLEFLSQHLPEKYRDVYYLQEEERECCYFFPKESRSWQS